MSQSPEPSPAATRVDPNRPSTAAFVTGWLLTILPAAGLIFSGVMKLIQPGPPEEVAKYLDPIGWKLEQMVGLGILELTCVIIYLIPQTAVLGAILVTGYIGSIIATHVRVGDFGIVPFIIVGVLIWLGLFLRYRGCDGSFRSSFEAIRLHVHFGWLAAQSISPVRPTCQRVGQTYQWLVRAYAFHVRAQMQSSCAFYIRRVSLPHRLISH